jgi:hypothetical protein
MTDTIVETPVATVEKTRHFNMKFVAVAAIALTAVAATMYFLAKTDHSQDEEIPNENDVTVLPESK